MAPTNLKLARERFTNLTQEEVAEKLGITLSTYQKWEQGQRGPNGKNLILLSEVLGVSVDTILGTEYSELRGDDDYISAEEHELIETFRTLSIHDKAVVVRVVTALAKS